MLTPLRATMAGRRTRRLAARGAGACALLMLAVAGLRMLPSAPVPTVPAPEVAVNPIPAAIPAPVKPTPASAPKFTVTVLRNDPAIVARYRAASPPNSLIERLTDEQLLAALEAAGTPGYIRIGGRVVLSRELDHVKPERPEPRSSLPPDSSHG